MSSKGKMLSLLKWTQGEDKGLYTIGIKTEWIKNFNDDDFKNEKYDPDKKFAVEWRDSKKMPLGGWKCYMAQVIHISGKQNIFPNWSFIITVNVCMQINNTRLIFLASETWLEKKLGSICGTESPRAIPEVRDFLFFKPIFILNNHKSKICMSISGTWFWFGKSNCKGKWQHK